MSPGIEKIVEQLNQIANALQNPITAWASIITAAAAVGFPIFNFFNDKSKERSDSLLKLRILKGGVLSKIIL